MWRTNKTPKYLMMILCMLFVSLGFAASAFATSVTITSGTTWNDTSGNSIQAHGGGMIKVGSTYYWFGESKGANAPDVDVYSSTDLATWTFQAHALVPLSSGDLTSASVVERPKVMYNSSTQKYVMYFHLDDSSYAYAHVGVATSSTVTGPYTYQGSYQPLGHDSRDMGVYQDTDGSAYLISSVDGNLNLSIFKLSADYLSAASLVQTWSSVHYEAPAMVKQNGVYFLLTSKQNGWSPAQQQYTTSTSLSSGWSSWTNIGGSTNYSSQTTFIMPIQGSAGTTYLYMADRWNSSSLSTSTYIWMPMVISGTTMSYDSFASWKIDAAAGTFFVPSTEVPNTSNWYYISNVNSGKVMDVTSSSTAAGALIKQYTLNNGYNQEWQFVLQSNGYYKIKNRNSGLYLDVSGGTLTPGLNIIQQASSSSNSQLWTLQLVGSGHFGIVNVNSLQIIDVNGASTANSAQLLQWTDLNATNQHWSITQATN
ncbi:hypothetical protein A8709_04125 [Paenibacillus pectinilyticus]|uniref:Ricin B lectin domain-containing protein n=1 Tax=Paenibacillus pectinilyticus TaxID=512399 RepID=A0A1C0ZS35_9BACL|nr:RICIN domain-containing protein [Paenibacillus pectinilyticus]OCT10899.1 hypothetical protein A8709_04125 [Paenibacillus pectinilyticus]